MVWPCPRPPPSCTARSTTPSTRTGRPVATTSATWAFELDSLDFLTFVELLSGATGRPIPEADYPQLRTLNSCVSLLDA